MFIAIAFLIGMILGVVGWTIGWNRADYIRFCRGCYWHYCPKCKYLIKDWRP